MPHKEHHVELEQLLGMLPAELQAQLANLPPQELAAVLEELLAGSTDPLQTSLSGGNFSIFLTPKSGASPLPGSTSSEALGIGSRESTQKPIGPSGKDVKLSKRQR